MPQRRLAVLFAALAALTLAACAGRQPPVAGGAGDASAGEVASPESAPAEAGEVVEETVVEETGAAAAETVVEEVVETVAEPAAIPETAPAGGSMAGPPGSGIATGRPYVVIRFTESDVDYQPALAEAVRAAVARKPGLAFDLVAVTPAAASADDLADNAARARGQADDVMQSLAGMGIGRDRVSVASWNGLPSDVNEIRLYIR